MTDRNITTKRIMDAIAERDGDIRPYCDILVRVQDGKPVYLEVTQKFKPTIAAGDHVYARDADRHNHRIDPPKPPKLIGSETVYRP